jgi:hypothetical protein
LSLDAEFPWIEVGAVDLHSPQGFVRNRMIRPADLGQWRDRYDNKDVYCTTYRYREQDKKGDLYGHLYFDLDSPDYELVKADAVRLLVILEALFGVKPEDLWIFYSGGKGIHIIVPADVMGINPHPNLNEIFKLLATTLSAQTANKTVDLRVYDRVRLFRLPNSQHGKSLLFKVPLSVEELIQCDLSQIKALAAEPRKWQRPTLRHNAKAASSFSGYIKQWEASKIAQKFSRESGVRHLDFVPPCIKHMLQEGAAEGQRNHTLAALANHFKQRGYSEDHTIRALSKWNQRAVSPPVAEIEVTNTVRSIFTREYHYGCTTLEQLAPCDKDNCAFGKYKTT